MAEIAFHFADFRGITLRRFIYLLGCFATTHLAAEPLKLTGDAIKQVVTGSALELDTHLGTTVSVRFNPDGLMSGDAKELASLLGAATDRGRWWVANNQLCYKWFRWFDAEARCLALGQEAKRIFWQRDDGESGTATIVEQGKPVVPAEVSVVAQKPVMSSNDQYRANKAQVQESDAVAVLNTRSHFARVNQDKAAVEPSPRAHLPKKSPSTTERLGIDAKVPVPHLATRPKPRLATTPQLTLAKTQTSKKSHIPSFKVAGVDASDVLNIRNGPSPDDYRVGEIPPTGRGIVIIGRCLDDWCPIQHQGLTGWVNRYYLTEEASR